MPGCGHILSPIGHCSTHGHPLFQLEFSIIWIMRTGISNCRPMAHDYTHTRTCDGVPAGALPLVERLLGLEVRGAGRGSTRYEAG